MHAPHSQLEPLSVLLVVDNLTDDSGGAERFVVDLALELQILCDRVVVAATREISGALPVLLRDAGIGVFSVGRRKKSDIWRLVRLRKFIRSEQFDVVHSHKFGSNFWASIISFSARVPVHISHEHTWSFSGNRIRQLLDRYVVARLSDMIVAVSRADRERMIAVERIPSRKITVVSTGVPRSAFASKLAEATDLRSELGLLAESQIVFTAAMFRPQKRLDRLISAMAKVRTELPDAHLVLAGDGPERASLVELSRELDLQDSVHFIGIRSDVDQLLRQSTLAALSSDFEGLPLFALQAMACGTPLVATNVGGLTELIDNGVSGLLVPTQSDAALAGCLTAALAEPELRTKLAENARTAVEPLTMAAIAAQICEIYVGALETNRRGS
jgi:glycosyltransferase involved in cell wall biosynthesis